MARTTYVKAAQQRYKMVPVLNEDGTPKRTAVMRRNGQQKTTKTGRPVFMDVTVADKNQPLPNHKCEKCGEEIKVGSPYKHVTPKSGPYGGRTRRRCAACPGWQPWDLSSSLSARTAEIAHDFWTEIEGADESDTITSALESAAERIREIAEEKREGAQNIEDGFGHETYQSQELNDIADQLDSWADDVEGAEVPDLPDIEEQDCDECGGSGEVDNPDYLEVEAAIEEHGKKIEAARRDLKLYMAAPAGTELTGKIQLTQALLQKLLKEQQTQVDALAEMDAQVSCEECNGSGTVEPEELTDEQMDEWRSDVESNCSIVDECPV